MQGSKSKVAVISHVLPPSPSGQAVMLFRILSGMACDDFFLISRESIGTLKDIYFSLKAGIFILPVETNLCRPNIFGLVHICNLANILVRILIRSKNILNIIRRESTSAIIACTGDLEDIPAAFLASRIAHIPFFAYIFDDYVYQWTGSYRLIAKFAAYFIFKHSAGIIGPNEFICEEYQRRYNVKTMLVRNPCDKNELGKEIYQPWPAMHDKFVIIYTGAVYHANFDCFRNLIIAMRILSKFNLELHIYTAQPVLQIESQGIHDKKVFIHSHLLYSEILEQQHKADILFLPLAFESPIQEVIRTSAPGKMGEYLASGRPVLAHVPADSYVAHYFNKHGCGWLIDKNDPQELANGIENIIINSYSRSLKTGNAKRFAMVDFSPDIAQTQLCNFFNKTFGINLTQGYS